MMMTIFKQRSRKETKGTEDDEEEVPPGVVVDDALLLLVEKFGDEADNVRADAAGANDDEATAIKQL